MSRFQPLPELRTDLWGDAQERATSKTLDWIEARERGERLPQHELTDETEARIWAVAMETLP